MTSHTFVPLSSFLSSSTPSVDRLREGLRALLAEEEHEPGD